MEGKARALVVGRTRFSEPLDPATRRKLDALSRRLDLRVLACEGPEGGVDDPSLHLVPPTTPRVLDGPRFYATLPLRIARELRDLDPDVVVAESPFIGYAALSARRLARKRLPVIVEVHGDWRGATRLYGSRLRGLLGPLSDKVAEAALRKADRVRALSPFTVRLLREIGVEPFAAFPAYTDLAEFAAPPRPLPATPRVLFVGILERYKNVDGLARAWRRVAAQVADATLHVVGDGSEAPRIRRLVADFPGRVEWTRTLTQGEVAEAMDAASLLALPSRSEGLPRVAIEALARGRPVVGSDAGGIPDIVVDGQNGTVVRAGDDGALVAALTGLLQQPAELARRAALARASVTPWLQSPDDFARRFEALVHGRRVESFEAARPAERRVPAAA